MTKTKKTVLWSVIGCLCVLAIAGTAIGVTYSQYRSAATSLGLASIPKWDFDLTTSSEDSFYVDTSTKLSPDQSIYTDSNTNRSSVSDPIAIAKITNKGEVSGDVSVSASLNQTNPYNPNSKYQANETFESEFLDHFLLTPYYSLDGEKLTEITESSLITLYPESEVQQDNSLYNSLYIYVTVTWLSDINGENGDAFDTWVGRYIDSINLSISFAAYQHGDFTPTQANAKLGVQVSDYECLYFDGTTDQSGHLNTTTNYEDAVELIIAEVKENEYTLGFYASDISPTSYYASETLTYIGYSGSGTGGFTLTSDPYIWLYDDDYDVFYTYDSNGAQRFIGNQSGSDYLGCFAWSNINSSGYNTGSSFESEPELKEAPNEPQEGDPTYKLGVLDGDTYKYFNGTVNSNHMITTTSYEEAVDVYITPLNDDVDNTCTLSFYDTSDTLQYIATSGSNSANMKLQTSAYTWIWDDTNEYFYDPNDNNRYLGCQTGQDYFAAYASSNNYLHVIPYTSNPDLLAPESIIVTADQGKTEIEVGDHGVQLYASISPSSGVNQHVIWSSSDDDIATVDQTGLVLGLSEGEVIIYATSEVDSAVKGEYQLTVTTPSELVYKESEEFVAAEIYSSVTSGSKTLTDEKIYGDLVTISFASNGGSTAPQYYYSGLDYRIYAKNQVIFTPVDESIAEISKIEFTYSTTYYGNDTATFTDASGNEAGTITNPKTSGGTITIDVTGSGEVIYCNDNSAGTNTQLRCTKITIYYDVPNDTVPETISISGDSNEIEVGETLQLNATVSPDTANQKIKWSSDDESVASVDQTGLVKGVSEGDTTIKATSILSDEVYGTYSIKVNPKDVSGMAEGLIGTYEFANGGRTSNSSSVATTAIDTFFKTDGVYVPNNVTTNPYNSCSAAEKVGLGADGSSSGGLLVSNNCLKLGTSSAAGSITITFDDVTISEVVLWASSWNDSNTPVGLSVNDEASVSINQPGSNYSSIDDLDSTTFTLSSATDTITITSSKPSSGDYRAIIYRMEIYYYS